MKQKSRLFLSFFFDRKSNQLAKQELMVIFDQIWFSVRGIHGRDFYYFFCFVWVFFNINLFYFNWRLITLQYCIGFAIHWHESAMGVHVLTPLPPPSPYHPSGSPSAPAPSILYHASNLDWQFVSHMIIYISEFISIQKQMKTELAWKYAEFRGKDTQVSYLCWQSVYQHF